MINRKTNSFSISSLWLAGILIKVGGINLLGNQEPWGVVCVGYVNEGSANHQLLKKLGAVTEESDEALWELQAGKHGETWWNMFCLHQRLERAKQLGYQLDFAVCYPAAVVQFLLLQSCGVLTVFSGFWNVGSTDVVSCRSMSFQVPMIAAKDWQEQETLHLVRRNYAAKLWEMIQLSPLDSDPVVFPGDGKWKDWNPWSSLEIVPH